MIIRYAEEKNFIELRQFYDGMCKVLSGKDFLPEGDKGGFPPDEMIKDAIKERNQFIGIEDGRIVAAYIMNHDCDEAYHAVKWLIDAMITRQKFFMPCVSFRNMEVVDTRSS